MTAVSHVSGSSSSSSCWPLRQQPERYIIVGLDFGTYASGFAYSTDGGRSVRQFTSYPDQTTPYPKALTAILYQDGEPVQWGWTARKDFMALSQEDRWVASVAKSYEWGPGQPATASAG